MRSCPRRVLWVLLAVRDGPLDGMHEARVHPHERIARQAPCCSSPGSHGAVASWLRPSHGCSWRLWYGTRGNSLQENPSVSSPAAAWRAAAPLAVIGHVGFPEMGRREGWRAKAPAAKRRREAKFVAPHPAPQRHIWGAAHLRKPCYTLPLPFLSHEGHETLRYGVQVGRSLFRYGV